MIFTIVSVVSGVAIGLLVSKESYNRGYMAGRAKTYDTLIKKLQISEIKRQAGVRW